VTLLGGGSQHTLTSPTYFQGVKTPKPQDLRPCQSINDDDDDDDDDDGPLVRLYWRQGPYIQNRGWSLACPNSSYAEMHGLGWYTVRAKKVTPYGILLILQEL